MNKVNKDDRHEDLALCYLQTLATPGGLEILADLRKTFDYAWYPDCGVSLEIHAGARIVLEHIINKMKSVNKKAAAQIVFDADCI